nr:hypothetical protein Iba_chr09fCG1480 [Ipomoea batatas]
MYPFPETAEREQQMGKIVIEDVGAVIGIVATVDEVKCQLLRNLWLPFALPKSARLARTNGLKQKVIPETFRCILDFPPLLRPGATAGVLLGVCFGEDSEEYPLDPPWQCSSPSASSVYLAGDIPRSQLRHALRLPPTVDSSTENVRFCFFRRPERIEENHDEDEDDVTIQGSPELDTTGSESGFSDLDLNRLADLRSKVESLVRETALAAIVVVPGGSVGAPAGNIRRNGPRKHQRRWIIDVRFPALFLRPKLLLLSMLRLGGDESEKLLPETGSANADAATDIGKVLLTPHSYDRTPSVQLTAHIQVRPWEARIPARNPDIRGGYGF